MMYFDINNEARQKIINELKNLIPQNKQITIVCIGTPKIVGDSVGPLIGTMLKEGNINANVLGDLENPVTALNINDVVNSIDTNSFVIGIDACIGSNVKQIKISNSPIEPASSLGKDLSLVGDISIKVIVTDDDLLDIVLSLLKVNMSLVYKSAKIISESLLDVIGVNCI